MKNTNITCPRLCLHGTWLKALGEWPKGHILGYWDAGGPRYKAVGEPRECRVYPGCGKAGWLKVRKKAKME